MLGARNTKADGNRRRGEPAQGFEKTMKLAVELLALAGNAGSGNRIQKTSGAPCNLLHSFGRTGRCDKEDGVQAGAAHDLYELVRFFNGEIRCENSIDTALHAVFSKPAQPIIEERVVIAEQQEWNLRLRADFRCELEHFGQTDTIAERPFCASLYHRTIGNGIGKRHAQFNDISA